METETYVYNIDSFNSLYNACWSGALYTLNDIKEANKEDELINYLNTVLESYDNGLEITQLNDHLWFDRDYIYEELGIQEEEE